LHGEVESHEFADWREAGEGGTDGETGEAGFCDRRVDDTFFTESIEEALCYFVSIP